MGLLLNREDVQLGAIPVGVYVTNTSTTPSPTDLPNRAIEWNVLPRGTATQVLTVKADGCLGWAAPATNGTVTSVTYTGDGVVYSSTPTTAVTASGTLTPALSTQAANIVLAGPTSGATAVAPTFRAIVNADLPASGRGSGTVTSVSLTGDGTVLSATPSTAVTASGTVTAALATHAANLILAGPATGQAAAPTFRALDTADLPTVIAATTITIGSNHMTWGAAAPITGTWAVGDICWNTGVTSSTSPGWICTNATDSGTWTAMPAPTS